MLDLENFNMIFPERVIVILNKELTKSGIFDQFQILTSCGDFFPVQTQINYTINFCFWMSLYIMPTHSRHRTCARCGNSQNVSAFQSLRQPTVAEPQCLKICQRCRVCLFQISIQVKIKLTISDLQIPTQTGSTLSYFTIKKRFNHNRCSFKLSMAFATKGKAAGICIDSRS